MVWVLDSIFYKHTVVGNDTYSTYTKIGGTLPVLKNEIKDFFFSRLGTGGIYGPPLRSEKHTMMDKIKYFKHKKRTGACHATNSFIYNVICEEFSMRNVCSVGYTIDVNDSFLLFVEMSSDVFV